MKRIALFFIIVFALKVSAQQTFNPFNLDNIEWEILFWSSYSGPPDYCSFNHYKLCGDSIYNGVKYKRIFAGSVAEYPATAWAGCQPLPPPSTYLFYGLFRQDSILKRNYLRLASWSHDSLLMDYSLNVGDTVKKGLYYNQVKGGCPSYPLKIVSIDSAVIGNHKFRVLYTDTSGANYDNIFLKGCCFIEGLGHIAGVFQETYCPSFEGGYGVDSINFSATCNNIGFASISQISSLNSNISIYPNPNNGSFIIEPNNGAKQTMQVYDVNGKLVLSQTIEGKTNIDASTLNEGVYNISIISANGILNKRLVIVR